MDGTRESWKEISRSGRRRIKQYGKMNQQVLPEVRTLKGG